MAVLAQDNGVVTFLAADFTIEIDDNEVSFDRAGIKALPVAFERFPHGQRILLGTFLR